MVSKISSLCCSLFAFTQLSIVIQSKLVAWYSFDGDADDRSDNHFDCTGENVVTSPDRFGTEGHAYWFNGINASIRCPNVTDTISNAASRSICAWAKVDGASTGSLFEYGGLAECSSFGLRTLNGHSLWRIQLWDDCDRDGKTFSILPDTWHHHCLTLEGHGIDKAGEIKWWVNGDLFLRYEAQADTEAGKELRIGLHEVEDYDTEYKTRVVVEPWSQRRYFSGWIDDVRVYDTALLPTQIRELAAFENPTPAPTVNTANAMTPQMLQLAVERGEKVELSNDVSLDHELIVNATSHIQSTPGVTAAIDGKNMTRVVRVTPRGNLTLERIVVRFGRALATEGGGGGILVEGGHAMLRETVVTSNIVLCFGGGGIHVTGEGSVLLEKTVVESNYATACSEGYGHDEEYGAGGGGILVSGGSALMASNSLIYANRAFCCHGGGIHVANFSSLVGKNLSFTANVYDLNRGFGGGLSCLSYSTCHVETSVFEYNVGTHYRAIGGGIACAYGGSCRISNSTFQYNEAQYKAGAGFVEYNASLIISDSSIYGNMAHGNDGAWDYWGYGGAFFASGTSTFELLRCLVTDNHAHWDADSVLNYMSSRIAIRDSIVDGKMTFGSANTIEVYNTVLPATGDIIEVGTSTVHLAFLTFDAAATNVTLDASSTAFLYLSNGDANRTRTWNSVLEYEDDTTIDWKEYTYPCASGSYSADGTEHGSRWVDQEGRSIDDWDPTCKFDAKTQYSELQKNSSCVAKDFLCHFLESCLAPCTPCPSGTFLEFSLNRFKHIGVASCSTCPVGKYLPDQGTDATLHDSVDDCIDCEPGTYSSISGASQCEPCAPGTYASQPGSFVCTPASPGYFVEDSAKEPSECEPGRASVGGASQCEDCQKGYFAAENRSTSCDLCLIPLTTTGTGKDSCDSCQEGWYWNTDSAEGIDVKTTPVQELRILCQECDNDGMDCDKGNMSDIRLDNIPMSKNYWRATDYATEVYECHLSDACRGGAESGDNLCARGHHGALCGACENSFYLDAARNRCVSCSVPTTPTKTMAPIVIVSTAAFIITCLSVLLCGRASVFRFVSSAFLSVFKPAPAGKEAYESAIEFARGDGEDQGAANDTKESVADESEARADGTEGCTYSQNYSRDSQRDSLRESSRDAEDGRRDRFWKSVLIKLKIIIAGYQIAGATTWVLPTVDFPDIFKGALWLITSWTNLDIATFGVTSCWMQLNYYQQLCVVALFPFVLISLGGLLLMVKHACFVSIRDKSARARIINEDRFRATYALLLVLFVCLPGCSSFTFRYFSCSKFDRGAGRNKLKVLSAALDVKCSGDKYREWRGAIFLFLFLWPLGVPMTFAACLWRAHDKRKVDAWKDQVLKLELRSRDPSIRSISFLWEEFEPRRWWFPIFDCVRRLFFTGCLSLFYPGSASQLIVGLFASAASSRFFQYFAPYIADDDNTVSEAAQMQTTFLYFAALIVHISEKLHHREGLFSSDYFGVVLILITSASFLVAAYFIIMQIFGYEYTHDIAVSTVRRLSSRASSLTKLGGSFYRSPKKRKESFDSEASPKEHSLQTQ